MKSKIGRQIFLGVLGVIGALFLQAATAAGMPLVLLDQKALPAIIRDRGAKVLEVTKLAGGMTAYSVEKDGKPLVIYVTADSAVAFVGVMFDAQTGANLSDVVVQRAENLAKNGAKPKDSLGSGVASEVAAAPNRPANADVQKISSRLSSAVVAGITEGKGSPGETTFVFFDPRCPYCHKLYLNSRDLVVRGATVKWIPVNTLGDAGLPISAEVLRRGLPGLEAMANGRLLGGPPVSEKSRTEIEANTVFMKMVTQQAGLTPATPTIVFQGKTGKFSIIQDDGSDKVALAASFGRAIKGSRQ